MGRVNLGGSTVQYCISYSTSYSTVALRDRPAVALHQRGSHIFLISRANPVGLFTSSLAGSRSGSRAGDMDRLHSLHPVPLLGAHLAQRVDPEAQLQQKSRGAR